MAEAASTVKAEAAAKVKIEVVAKARADAEAEAIRARVAAATATSSATGILTLPGLESLHGKVDILAAITSDLVQTLRDLQQKTLPSVQGAIISNEYVLSSFREPIPETIEGQTQAIQDQDALIKEHSSLIRDQAVLLKTQSQAIEELTSLIKNTPALASTPTLVAVFNDADRALLTNMTTLLQICLSAEVQVHKPATAEGERTVDTSEHVNVESDEEGEDEDEDDEENPDDEDTLSKSRRADDDDDDGDDVIQVNRVAVRKIASVGPAAGTSETEKASEENPVEKHHSSGGAEA